MTREPLNRDQPAARPGEAAEAAAREEPEEKSTTMANKVTIASYCYDDKHSGGRYEIDHLGAAAPEDQGVFHVSCDDEMIAEFRLENPRQLPAPARLVELAQAAVQRIREPGLSGLISRLESMNGARGADDRARWLASLVADADRYIREDLAAADNHEALMRAHGALTTAVAGYSGTGVPSRVQNPGFAPGSEEAWSAVCRAGRGLAEALRGCSHGRHRGNPSGPGPQRLRRRGTPGTLKR